VRTGNLVFVSGMLGRRADLSFVEEPEAQLIKMFDNLDLVLTEAVCDWNRTATRLHFVHAGA